MLCDSFQHDVQFFNIPLRHSQQKTERAIKGFIENHAQDPGALVVIFYAGHSGSGDKELYLGSDGPAEVRWRPCQEKIMSSKADVLLLFDSCLAGTSVDDFLAIQKKFTRNSNVQQQRSPTNIEILAATDSYNTTPLKGRHTFTKRLAKVMSPYRFGSAKSSVTILMRGLYALYRSKGDDFHPFHLLLQGDTSIVLGPRDPFNEQVRIENMIKPKVSRRDQTLHIAVIRDGRRHGEGLRCGEFVFGSEKSSTVADLIGEYHCQFKISVGTQSEVFMHYRGLILHPDWTMAALAEIKASLNNQKDLCNGVFVVVASLDYASNAFGGMYQGCIAELRNGRHTCPVAEHANDDDVDE
ncbi:hypothetical protein EJ08DRAFT_241121 [Tothia fuscella]|uniref:Uncharacterized protein n=1 Tax=Tothia fuscella TaxID=1048955 RepID=A0A9P4NSC5_9PEZI|nr:hypothetical protein EJ08DRAFT_241121 [Tothia fuscella]